MPRASAKADTMPTFKTAAEKRAWLLEQLNSVEREAVLEDIAAGRNDRITIRIGDKYRIDAGEPVLYDGSDAVKFCEALGGVIEALPLGSTFQVEAGKGGKVLCGGVEEEFAPEPAAGSSRARSRKPKGGDGV
jgi:hypothetical protein